MVAPRFDHKLDLSNTLHEALSSQSVFLLLPCSPLTHLMNRLVSCANVCSCSFTSTDTLVLVRWYITYSNWSGGHTLPGGEGTTAKTILTRWWFWQSQMPLLWFLQCPLPQCPENWIAVDFGQPSLFTKGLVLGGELDDTWQTTGVSGVQHHNGF